MGSEPEAKIKERALKKTYDKVGLDKEEEGEVASENVSSNQEKEE